jgi:rubrerythrin
MSQKDSLTTLIKQHADIERDNVKRIVEMRKTTRNAAAKLLLLEMRLDSEKHEAILTEMLEALKGIPPGKSLWEHELEEYIGGAIVRKEFEEHVKKEDDVLAHLEKELKHTKDEGLKLLLQNIAEDEKKHQRILQAMVKNLYKLEK